MNIKLPNNWNQFLSLVKENKIEGVTFGLNHLKFLGCRKNWTAYEVECLTVHGVPIWIPGSSSLSQNSYGILMNYLGSI